jgi:hypothetical protein
LAERALSAPLHGAWPMSFTYPEALAQQAPERWRFHARFALDDAAKHASRGDHLATVSMAGKAVIEEARARLCEQRRWVTNEKQIVQAAELERLQAHFQAPPSDPKQLLAWVDQLRDQLAHAA